MQVRDATLKGRAHPLPEVFEEGGQRRRGGEGQSLSGVRHLCLF